MDSDIRNYDEEIKKYNKLKELSTNLFEKYNDLDENLKDKLRTEILMFFYEHNKELKADEWEVAGCLFPEISFINLFSYFPEHKELQMILLERLNKMIYETLDINTTKKY